LALKLLSQCLTDINSLNSFDFLVIYQKLLMGSAKYIKMTQKFKRLTNFQIQLQKKEKGHGKDSLSESELREYQNNLTVLKALKKEIKKVSYSNFIT